MSIEVKQITETVKVPFKKLATPSLVPQAHMIEHMQTSAKLVEGVEGEAVEIYEVTYEGGVETERKRISSEITVEPIDELIGIRVSSTNFSTLLSGFFGYKSSSGYFGGTVYPADIENASFGTPEGMITGSFGSSSKSKVKTIYANDTIVIKANEGYVFKKPINLEIMYGYDTDKEDFTLTFDPNNSEYFNEVRTTLEIPYKDILDKHSDINDIKVPYDDYSSYDMNYYLDEIKKIVIKNAFAEEMEGIDYVRAIKAKGLTDELALINGIVKHPYLNDVNNYPTLDSVNSNGLTLDENGFPKAYLDFDSFGERKAEVIQSANLWNEALGYQVVEHNPQGYKLQAVSLPQTSMGNSTTDVLETETGFLEGYPSDNGLVIKIAEKILGDPYKGFSVISHEIGHILGKPDIVEDEEGYETDVMASPHEFDHMEIGYTTRVEILNALAFVTSDDYEALGKGISLSEAVIKANYDVSSVDGSLYQATDTQTKHFAYVDSAIEANPYKELHLKDFEEPEPEPEPEEPTEPKPNTDWYGNDVPEGYKLNKLTQFTNNFATIFRMDEEALRKFSNPKAWLGTGSYYDTDVYNSINALFSIPFKLPDWIVSDTKKDITNYTQLVEGETNPNAPYLLDNNIIIPLGDIKVPKEFNNVYDYKDTDVMLHAPYLRQPLSIDPTYIVGSSVAVDVAIDLYSGDTTLNVYSKVIDNGLVERVNIPIKHDVPLFANRSRTLVEGAVGGFVRLDTEVAYVEVIRNKPYPIRSIFGKEANDYGLLSSFEGYVEVSDIQIEMFATVSEQARIKTLLNQGVTLPQHDPTPTTL